MKYEMSLRGSIFDSACKLFDNKLRGVLDDLLDGVDEALPSQEGGREERADVVVFLRDDGLKGVGEERLELHEKGGERGRRDEGVEGGDELRLGGEREGVGDDTLHEDRKR